ncbi:MAG TPA: GntR family transcriptional regulator [Terracidiphilus sp.]|nr:GntR family transcriptional regulator [Terracidiphilus sp.]
MSPRRVTAARSRGLRANSGKQESSRHSGAKAEHGSSVNLAFQRIRELIVHCKLAPGAWIPESELCAQLNMSRTPVRGALYLLQREGYVLQQRNASKSRMVAAPLTLEDAEELYPMIGSLEGLAGRRAALLPATERDALAERLEKINNALDEIARSRTAAGASIFDLDREFHRLVVSAGAGPRLKRLHQAIEPQAERYWRLYSGAIVNNLEESVAEHCAIITALAEGQAKRLEQALRANWENGCRRLAGVIQMFGERGNW